MAQAAAAKLDKLPDCPELDMKPERIKSFKFMVLDHCFTDPKTNVKHPVQFIFEDWHLELHHNMVYDASNLPEGIPIDDLVHHLNTRAGYPVHEMKQAKDPMGNDIQGQFQSVQTGWDPRFECVNMRYA
jgi:hypothetical protein